jgi:hypothetical protein
LAAAVAMAGAVAAGVEAVAEAALEVLVVAAAAAVVLAEAGNIFKTEGCIKKKFRKKWLQNFDG